MMSFMKLLFHGSKLEKNENVAAHLEFKDIKSGSHFVSGRKPRES